MHPMQVHQLPRAILRQGVVCLDAELPQPRQGLLQGIHGVHANNAFYCNFAEGYMWGISRHMK